MKSCHVTPGVSREIEAPIDLPCMQREIAEMAGLSRNSVGPVMRQLAKEGLLHQARNRIRYNPVQLREAMGW